MLEPTARKSFAERRLWLRTDIKGRPFIQCARRSAPDSTASFIRLAKMRRSTRQFGLNPLEFNHFSQFLEVLADEGKATMSSRFYSSAGRAYPVQTYLFVKRDRIVGVPGGAYYYNPVAHRLVQISEAELGSDAHFPANRAMAGVAAFTLCLVSSLEAVEPLYGSFAHSFALIEAGEMAQMLELEAVDTSIGLCGLGYLEWSLIAPSLHLEPANYKLLYSLVGGPRLENIHSMHSSQLQHLQRQSINAVPNNAVQSFAGLSTVKAADADQIPTMAKTYRENANVDVELKINMKTIEETIVDLWKELIEVDEIDRDDDFFDLGGNSLSAAKLYARILEKFPISLEMTDLFIHSTVRRLGAFIADRISLRSANENAPLGGEVSTPALMTFADSTDGSAAAGFHDRTKELKDLCHKDSAGEQCIAVIGVTGRFPGASGLEPFWEQLVSGHSSVGPLPEARRRLLRECGQQAAKIYTGSYLSDIEMFDPAFFRLSPREARKIDPAQRILLEMSVELLEQAAYMGGQLSGSRTGVYIGACPSQYWRLLLEHLDQDDLSNVITGNMSAILANRISHFHDLKGPSVALDTACSSSLVALDIACRAILSRDIDAAIVGSVNLLLYPPLFAAYQQDGMASTQGKCRAFDANADGFVRGEGAAMVLLKPLQSAIQDRDFIHAVIRGSASNHAGAGSALSVPNAISQQEAIVLAHRRAGIAPAELSYIEAHGTGTSLGDPIELRGLGDAFRTLAGSRRASNEDRNPLYGYCAIGSVKTNIGHLEGTAGLAGLIKVLLALQYERLPPSLHFSELNPEIDLLKTPFYVCDKSRDWKRGKDSRVAAVSSFGVGGTNAHVVVEEAPVGHYSPLPTERSVHLFCLSARSYAGLRELAESVTERLQAPMAASYKLPDICFSANVGRRHWAYRVAIVARDVEQLCDRLALFITASLQDHVRLERSLIFVGCHGNKAWPVRTAHIKAKSHTVSGGSADVLAEWCSGELWESTYKPCFSRITFSEQRELPTTEADWANLLAIVGDLFVAGVEVDFSALEANSERYRIPLPATPFERQRCWFDLAAQDAFVQTAPVSFESTSLDASNTDLSVKVATDDRGLNAEGSGSGGTLVQFVTFITERISELTEIPIEKIDPMQPLAELGMDSVMATKLMDHLSKLVAEELELSIFFDHPTVLAMAEYLSEAFSDSLASCMESKKGRSIEEDKLENPHPFENPHPTAEPMLFLDGSYGPKVRREPAKSADAVTASSYCPASQHNEPIAVIGMAGRFPGAASVSEFWTNLRNGVCAVNGVPSGRELYLRADELSFEAKGGFLNGINQFDPLFFRLSDREARSMDPQQRMLLEVAWETVENAGYAQGQLGDAPTGVFVGASYTHTRDVLTSWWETAPDAHGALGNHNAILSNRLSYFLDLKGPSLTIDTLCSSSLVALHLATQSLCRHEIDYALVAGVHVGISGLYLKALRRLKAMSTTGMCYTFDARADGYVPGEGVGAVLLARLSDAVAQKAFIHAIVLGSASNHSGQSPGLTVPTKEAQRNVIRAAIENAGIRPEEVSYLEAHGTGTSLGDPIEIGAASEALGGPNRMRASCAIGSLKTNLGHLEPAAGIASLLKVVNAIKHQELPPTLHFEDPNPRIQFEETPFFVNERLRPWTSSSGRLCAGISAFGLGGTNAHVIVAAAPSGEDLRNDSTGSPPAHVLCLSARNSRSKNDLVRRFEAFVSNLCLDGTKQPEGIVNRPSLGDICSSANLGRCHFGERLAIVAYSLEDLLQKLRSAHILESQESAAAAVFSSESARLARSVQKLGSKLRRLPNRKRALLVDSCSGLVWKRDFQSLLEDIERDISDMADNDAGYIDLCCCLAELYVRGVDVEWSCLYPLSQYYRVPLPTYQFDRRPLDPIGAENNSDYDQFESGLSSVKSEDAQFPNSHSVDQIIRDDAEVLIIETFFD